MNDKFIDSCKRGNIEDVIESLKYADINYIDKKGNTGLLIASSLGHKDIVSLLIDKGCDLETQNLLGATAFLMAIHNAYIDIAELLINAGVNINHLDFDGDSALTYSVIDANKEIVQLLIQNNINVNIQDQDGNTSLMKSVYYQNSDIFEMILESGANIDIKNNDNETVYDMAVCGRKIMQQVMIKPESLNKIDNCGETILFEACFKKDEKLILYLYDKGADFYFKNRLGITPLDLLVDHKTLSVKLEALKEQLMMNKMIGDEDDNSMSL